MHFFQLLVNVCVLAGMPAGINADKQPVIHPSVWRLLSQDGQPVKVWVFLADKGCRSETELRQAIAQVQTDYNARAVHRRRLRGTRGQHGGELFSARDLLVASSYVDAIAQTGAAVCIQSRWLNAISVYANAEQVLRLAELDFVKRIQPVAQRPRFDPVECPFSPHSSLGGDGRGDRDPFYGLSFDHLAQINLVALHEQGFTGQGVVIGMLDTGFARSHTAFTYPGHPIDVIAEWDFVANDANAGYDPDDPVIPSPHGDVYQHAHGTIVLGTIAGYAPGEYVGGAYDASFVLAKTEDITDEYPAEEDLYVAGLEFIEMNGADMASSSLGYHAWYDWFDMDGLTAVTTIAVNIATSNGVVCCTAAGNGGRDSDLPTLIAPGDAFDVVTCGAVNSAGVLADFSSGGPTYDGRVKPEVLAHGEITPSVDPLDDLAYGTWDGTSMSTPLVASAVACVLQAHPTWTITQIRANLFETASDYVANGMPDPEFARGYGIVDALGASLDCNGNDIADLRETIAGGDFDADGDVDFDDFVALTACLGGPDVAPTPPVPTCVGLYLDAFDADADTDVDVRDFATFQQAVSE
ncbi:MAG: S8 family serine peptidase [Planctomycetota bacterium]